MLVVEASLFRFSCSFLSMQTTQVVLVENMECKLTGWTRVQWDLITRVKLRSMSHKKVSMDSYSDMVGINDRQCCKFFFSPSVLLIAHFIQFMLLKTSASNKEA